jgi:glycosyltransferase involved in cell wall biosynthesis
MRIIILNTQAPFVSGGAETLADGLQTKLIERGHQAEIVRIPFKWYPPEAILKHMLACRLLRVTGIEPDLVIPLKFPVYLIPFPNKRLWLLHQFRQVYELWGTPYQDLPNTSEGQRIREAIIQADNCHLPESNAIFALSNTVAKRLKTFNNIEATDVLYHPLLQPELFHSGAFEGYFFYPSRLTAGKRQAIAIQAMRYVRSNFKLILAGNPDNESYEDSLRQMIEQYDLGDRVQMLGWISDQDKARLMANAYGVLYLPYDEDSYGYVTLEAFHSHKPVVVFSDSGGTDEVMKHDFNGLILEPTPEALAAGMEQLWANRTRTVEMGQAAFETLSRYNISWDNVIENLLR